MILNQCPKCKRPGRDFCERYGRPCPSAEGEAAPYVAPRRNYVDKHGESIRRYWLEKELSRERNAPRIAELRRILEESEARVRESNQYGSGRGRPKKNRMAPISVGSQSMGGA